VVLVRAQVGDIGVGVGTEFAVHIVRDPGVYPLIPRRELAEMW
jgi:hypothetical protein